MSNFLLLLILFVLASVLLLIVYLIDRVNIIEKVTIDSPLHGKSGNSINESIFSGLSGEDLWNTMCGITTTDLDIIEINRMRPRYEIVLQKHIESLFEEGGLDYREGITKSPQNEMDVSTLRGLVKSWIPENYAINIYQLGSDKADPSKNLNEVKEKFDTLCFEIFEKVKVETKRPLSSRIFPDEEDKVKAGDNEPNNENLLTNNETEDAQKIENVNEIPAENISPIENKESQDKVVSS